jgi:dimethylhistidine N-methyltransferase
LGSGNASKARLLLDHLDRPATYVPVDVARAQLLDCSARLARDCAGLRVIPICGDYTDGFAVPGFVSASERTAVFFPGSTLGNFEPEEARSFLERMARICGARGGMLIGVDLKKSRRVLNAAYNDGQGVTARFNLNLLARANRELGANFKLEEFRHRAFYNPEAGRIEMHLVSRRAQAVSVSGEEFAFAPGESIATEHSYKYSLEGFRQLAARAGFEVVRYWTDAKGWFGVFFLR